MCISIILFYFARPKPLQDTQSTVIISLDRYKTHKVQFWHRSHNNNSISSRIPRGRGGRGTINPTIFCRFAQTEKTKKSEHQKMYNHYIK